MDCPICLNQSCGADACDWLVPANDNFKSNKRIVIVPHASQLLTKSYYARLAISTASLGLSRQEIVDWMHDRLYQEDVDIQFRDGTPYEIGDEDVYDAFNHDESFRWLSDFIASAANEPLQKPHHTIELRLRLLSLAFCIARPNVARHFLR
jgi:hypothetical protein